MTGRFFIISLLLISMLLLFPRLVNAASEDIPLKKQSNWLMPLQLQAPDNTNTEADLKNTNHSQAERFFMQRKVFKGPLNEAVAPDAKDTVSMAEWLALLYEAIGDKPWFLNDTAYYPDVPVTHWAFPAFEQFRLKNWFPREGRGEGQEDGFSKGLDDKGFAYPEKPVTRLEALAILGQTLEAQPYNWGSAQQLLNEYAVDMTTVPSLLTQENLARVIAAGFWPFLSGAATLEKGTPLDLAIPLTKNEAVQLAYHRYEVSEQRAAILTDEDKRLPEGLAISVSPTAVLFWDRLEVGMPLYFTLNSTITAPELPAAIPMGSRVFARVVSLTEMNDSVAQPMAKVVLEQVALFGGQKLTMNATVVFVFPKDEPRWFLPGSRFETITKRVERLTLPPQAAP